MKKRLLCLLLVLVTALALCVSAAATAQTGAQLNYVTDAAGLLREGERPDGQARWQPAGQHKAGDRSVCSDRSAACCYQRDGDSAYGTVGG